MRGLIIFTFYSLFVSCSGGGEETEPFLAFKDSELELVCEDTDTLIIESAGIDLLSWEVDNDFSITVDNNGIVKANRVGESIVTVKDNDSELQITCYVTVSPKYNTFIEPPLIFGSNQEGVKKEFDYADYSFVFGNDMVLNYKASTNVSMVLFNFNENKLVSIIVRLNDIKNIKAFLSERYKLISTIEDSAVISSYVNKDNDVSVTYKEEQAIVGSTITYTLTSSE